MKINIGIIVFVIALFIGCLSIIDYEKHTKQEIVSTQTCTQLLTPSLPPVRPKLR
jgi:hypothetical protein